VASTILSYKERHVSVPESPVIIVGYMLFYEAWVNANTPEDKLRFQQMTTEFQMSTFCVGCTDLNLDQLLEGDPKREAEFLTFVKLVRSRLPKFGKRMSVEYINQVIAIHEPAWKDGPLPTPWLHKVLDLIEALIQGKRLPPSGWLSHFRIGIFPSNRSHP
jgi:hypothetical protein